MTQKILLKGRKVSLFLTLVAISGGCSVINSFDDVVDEPPGDGDGDSSGGSETGGVDSGGSGGLGGSNMGGSDGTGGDAPIEPGLILAIESPGPLPDDEDILHFVSPQTGSELATDEADYRSATYEARRNVWFFVRNNEVIPGRFDRSTNSLNLLASSGPEVLGVAVDTPFMALNDRIALRAGQTLRIFDTSNLEAIVELDGVDLSPVLPATGLWDMTAATKTIGGNVNLLYRNCADLTDPTCPIEIASVAISPDTAVLSSPVTIVPDFDNVDMKQARGNLDFDLGAEQTVAVVPSATPIARAYLFSPDTLAAGSSFELPQPGNQIPGFVIDPCHSVGYANAQLAETLSGFAMVDGESVPLNKSIGIPGRVIAFEPHTRSIVTLNDENSDFGLFAFALTGTPTAPDVKKRIVDWSPPVFKPVFVATQKPAAPVCN